MYICVLLILLLDFLGSATASSLNSNQGNVLVYTRSFNKTSDDSDSTCGSVYYIWTAHKYWSDAREHCRSTNGLLLSIESKEENDYIHELVKSEIGEPIWTSGYFDLRAFKWYSSRVHFGYTNWGPNQPIISNPTFPVYFWSDAVTSNWRVDSVAALKSYICEDSCRTPKRCDTKTDLAIVLDGSVSINPNDFVLAKSFISALASAYETPSRITVIVFSSDVEIIFSITNSLTPAGIDIEIMGITQPAGITYTHLGIYAAIAELINSPVGVPRKMVVFTDGLSSNQQATALSAQEAKLNGITAYSVGIGNYYPSELLTIASGRQENVFTSTTFPLLFDQMKVISARLCIVD